MTDAPLPSSNAREMHGLVEPLISREKSKHKSLTLELSIVAVQFMEAACSARDGDLEATNARITHAIALLRGLPSLGPSRPRLLSNLDTQVVRGGLPAWQTRKVIAHVEANLSRRIRIREIAQILGLSDGHFCRAFKCSFGATPREYVLRRRIEASQALMLTTPESLGSIALKCGMCDQQHFTRSFHRIVGQTPSVWRRRQRNSLQMT